MDRRIEVCQKIVLASETSLKDVSFVEKLAREMGLHGDPNISDHYGKSNQDFLVRHGMLQEPRQLAEALVWLSDKEINTYLEIGMFNGSTTLFITTYLKAFNPDLCGYTVDNLRVLEADPYDYLKNVNDIKIVRGTSDKFKGEKFDLVFIDGDHFYKSVKKDYMNVGKHAKYCMFHDINDEWVDAKCEGGSRKFWDEIKKPTSVEFTYQEEGKPYFGLGIL